MPTHTSGSQAQQILKAAESFYPKPFTSFELIESNAVKDAFKTNSFIGRRNVCSSVLSENGYKRTKRREGESAWGTNVVWEHPEPKTNLPSLATTNVNDDNESWRWLSCQSPFDKAIQETPTHIKGEIVDVIDTYDMVKRGLEQHHDQPDPFIISDMVRLVFELKKQREDREAAEQ